MTLQEAWDKIRFTHPGDEGPPEESYHSEKLEQAFKLIEEALKVTYPQ